MCRLVECVVIKSDSMLLIGAYNVSRWMDVDTRLSWQWRGDIYILVLHIQSRTIIRRQTGYVRYLPRINIQEDSTHTAIDKYGILRQRLNARISQVVTKPSRKTRLIQGAKPQSTNAADDNQPMSLLVPAVVARCGHKSADRIFLWRASRIKGSRDEA